MSRSLQSGRFNVNPQGNLILLLLLGFILSAKSFGAQDPTPDNIAVPTTALTAATGLMQHLSVAEWMGPMAPIALSPFFGITCLSAVAMTDADWIAPGNPMLGANSPLRNPWVFFVFAGLTLLTSVPRLTKVSKPFAQAVDQLETWSGIITMVVLKMLLSQSSSSVDHTTETVMPVVQLGMWSVTVDVLMMIAAGLNILVITTVRFFFEVLIWLTPFPFLDAVFELTNKATCAALVTLYAWNPTVALVINLILFTLALAVFGWVFRREVFFRTLVIDRLRASISRPQPGSQLIVFPVRPVGAIKSRERCVLERNAANGWTLTSHRWLRPNQIVFISTDADAVLKTGLFSNTIVISNPTMELSFSHLYCDSLDDVAEKLALTRVLSSNVATAHCNA
jgi:hypothetical protein